MPLEFLDEKTLKDIRTTLSGTPPPPSYAEAATSFRGTWGYFFGVYLDSYARQNSEWSPYVHFHSFLDQIDSMPADAAIVHYSPISVRFPMPWPEQLAEMLHQAPTDRPPLEGKDISDEAVEIFDRERDNLKVYAVDFLQPVYDQFLEDVFTLSPGETRNFLLRVRDPRDNIVSEGEFPLAQLDVLLNRGGAQGSSQKVLEVLNRLDREDIPFVEGTLTYLSRTRETVGGEIIPTLDVTLDPSLMQESKREWDRARGRDNIDLRYLQGEDFLLIQTGRLDPITYALATSSFRSGTMTKVGDGLFASQELHVTGNGDKAKIQQLIKRDYGSNRKVK